MLLSGQKVLQISMKTSGFCSNCLRRSPNSQVSFETKPHCNTISYKVPMSLLALIRDFTFGNACTAVSNRPGSPIWPHTTVGGSAGYR